MGPGVHSEAIAGLAAVGTAVEGGHPTGVNPLTEQPHISRKEQPQRRSERRYDLRLDCELYRLNGQQKPVHAGDGKTDVWGRRSVLIQTDLPLSEGESVQVVSDWMFGLQLVVRGRVIRRDERGAALKITASRFQGNPAAFWDREVRALTAQRTSGSDLVLTYRA